MGDQSDVETALVAFAAGALYPNGTDEASVPGPVCRIYRGWPNPTALDNDLRAGVINVTVFPDPGPGQVTTRYTQEWTGTPAQPTLTASVSGTAASFGGTADTGQVAGILIDSKSYVYRTQPGDTPASVAANLAVQVRASRIARLSGSTLTIPGAGEVRARVAADAPSRKEIRRQVHTFHVTSWCPTPQNRDAAAIAIDQAMATLTFIDLSDGSQGRIVYCGTTTFDQSQNALLYRRDLLYSVEYATILAATQPAMLFGELDLNGSTLLV